MDWETVAHELSGCVAFGGRTARWKSGSRRLPFRAGDGLEMDVRTARSHPPFAAHYKICSAWRKK
jgi:hypothetical protein